MATTKDQLLYILDRLGETQGITYKRMMGEYLLYKDGTLFGGVYDGRLLIKPVKAAVDIMGEARFELPYPGAKPMLLIPKTDDRKALRSIVEAACEALSQK